MLLCPPYGLRDRGLVVHVHLKREHRVIAGVTTDVCVVVPVLSAIADSYEVQVVVDASGSLSPVSDDMALRRMERAGAVLTTTRPLLAELAGNLDLPSRSGRPPGRRRTPYRALTLGVPGRAPPRPRPAYPRTHLCT
ncbi:isochorismatase family protein [Nonomuraea sp. LPB2021202275-12-8]|uniref:isochorismatase family protein n=1 Tax=Nonomuraea sp. LPB2021202275-12-8 TaxID=3120159 RepID=UPI003FA57649